MPPACGGQQSPTLFKTFNFNSLTHTHTHACTQGYSRKGAALVSLDKLREAEEAYREALKLDPNNKDTKSALERLEKKQRMLTPQIELYFQ